MTRNMGSLDRGIRVVLGIALFVLAIFTNVTSGWVDWLLAIVGVVFVLTSTVGFCPLYTPFGIRTGGRNE